MKIEHKDCVWGCSTRKGTKNGKIDPYWRTTHKRARTVWKMSLFVGKYEDLIKRC